MVMLRERDTQETAICGKLFEELVTEVCVTRK